MIVDLRSDTFTQPTPGMLEAMRNAKTGDDVFGEDPTVNELEAYAAALFGKEAALYCPTGTMSNQIAIKAHTQPGDEVICDYTSHVYLYEGGGIAFNSGCSVRLLQGTYGKLTAAQIREAINPDDIHKPVSRLVSLENTANRGGGSCYEQDALAAIASTCRETSLSLHLDGARLFNAIVARKERPGQYGDLFDTISVCLNKGLGCPMGSILIGSAAFIRKARRIRKVFGGGMRQAGYMAATGLYALQNHVERLEEDHLHAKAIAGELRAKSFIRELFPVETNIVIAETGAGYPAATLVAALEKKGIRTIAMSPTLIRFVLHLDISPQMVDHTLQTLKSL